MHISNRYHCCAHTCRNRATVGCLERTDASVATIRGTAGTRGTVTASGVRAVSKSMIMSELKPLRRGKHRKGGPPHLQAYCERCQKLRYNCRRVNVLTTMGRNYESDREGEYDNQDYYDKYGGESDEESGESDYEYARPRPFSYKSVS